VQCAECPRSYVGQTGRTFKRRHKEHKRDIKQRTVLYVYPTYSPNRARIRHDKENNESQSQKLNADERFRIYEITKQNVQLNNTSTETYKPIYEKVLTTDPT
jgi:hypothetical protein